MPFDGAFKARILSRQLLIPMNFQHFVAAALTGLLCLPAFGQTLYRYVDGAGAVHYSDKPLLEASGHSVERLSRSGTHLTDKFSTDKPSGAGKAGEPALTDAQRKEQDAALQNEQRRNLALLATYNSLKEIDDAQTFALRDARRELREAQNRMVEQGRLREQLETRLDAGDSGVTLEMRQQLRNATLEFKSLAGLVEAKRRDVQSINERYDEDRRRYAQLLQKGSIAGDPAEAPPAAPRRD